MRIVDPDPTWYLDHVLVAAEPGGGAVGPIRLRQAAWLVAWEELPDRADLCPAVARLADARASYSPERSCACPVSPTPRCVDTCGPAGGRRRAGAS